MLPSICLAWGNDGHMIVGEIAWQQLTAEAKAAVASILRSDEDRKYHRLSLATLWADDIKSRRHPDNDRFAWARSLHYVNLPKDEAVYDAVRDCRSKTNCPSDLPCPERDCVVEAIGFYKEVLGNPSRTRQEKLLALRFLAHFVGDLHQPLHAGLGEDRGGNDIDVVFYGKRNNLHAIWDTDIIERYIALNRWEEEGWKRYADQLLRGIDASDRREWEGGRLASKWAEESSALAKRFAYNHAHGGHAIESGSTLDESYYRLGIMTIDTCLQKGGVRLGALLNEVFSNATER